MAIEFSGMNHQSALIGAGAVGAVAILGDELVNHKHRSTGENVAAGALGFGLAGAVGWGAYRQYKASGDEDSIGRHYHYGFLGPRT